MQKRGLAVAAVEFYYGGWFMQDAKAGYGQLLTEDAATGVGAAATGCRSGGWQLLSRHAEGSEGSEGLAQGCRNRGRGAAEGSGLPGTRGSRVMCLSCSIVPGNVAS